MCNIASLWNRVPFVTCDLRTVDCVLVDCKSVLEVWHSNKECGVSRSFSTPCRRLARTPLRLSCVGGGSNYNLLGEGEPFTHDQTCNNQLQTSSSTTLLQAYYQLPKRKISTLALVVHCLWQHLFQGFKRSLIITFQKICTYTYITQAPNLPWNPLVPLDRRSYSYRHF